MTEHARDNQRAEALEKLLGYLNFSEGRSDPHFQRTLADTYAQIVSENEADPWSQLVQQLCALLAELHESGAGAFREVSQAKAVMTLTFDGVLPAYRAHHADLLFHRDDRELFQPFFVARAIEAVLANGPSQKDADRLVKIVLRRLNDYVGHRPIALLETRPKGEPYDHERVRPIPLYIREAGTAPGRYHDVIESAVQILADSDPALLSEACFDLNQLDELALDPRAYDHGHPVNRRPNYIFGEWDPHLIDNKGHYRRFVIRTLTLDAILSRLEKPDDLAPAELLLEAGAVLAGTMLMASGVSGSGPDTHDSSVTLSNLIPRIARYRDAFYHNLLKKIGGKHAARLRQEMERTQHPFGGARQHLNQYLARHRAAQLQQRHLAMVMAELGYPEASRQQAARIPAASARILSEIHIRLTTGQSCLEDGKLERANQQLTDVEDILHRGIACGALVDPWNILGFGGLFPLFQAMEDSIRDPRIDELVAVVERTFNLYSRLLAETAATGNQGLGNRAAANMHKLATWWDRFATYEVSDVRPVHGGEAASSAEHVANALRLWHERGKAHADLAFWRDHLEGFRSPKAYALVVDALLHKEDYPAALGLLMHWLSQSDLVPLEDGEYTFHPLALRWMLSVCQSLQAAQDTSEASKTSEVSESQPPEMVKRFFDYLEANAGEKWSVPRLEIFGIPLEEAGDEEIVAETEEEEDIFEAAYENMIYEDSTDDDVDMEVLEIGPQPVFDLETEGERIERHLRFLSTVARLWNIAIRLTCIPCGERNREDAAALNMWLQQARDNYENLLRLLESIHDYDIPDPTGGYDSLVEYDRRRLIKERLLHVIIGTSLDTWLALAALRSRRGKPRKRISWKAELVLLEEALWKGNAAGGREVMPAFLEKFKTEPLLYTPLSSDGPPRQILRASRAQAILRWLAANLPRLGLLRHTFQVVQTAHDMERRQQLQGPRITEYARLFQIGCQSTVEALVEAAQHCDEKVADEKLLSLVERAILPYLPLWREHSKTLRVATLEMITNEAEWSSLRNFIQRYGRDLFHVRFMVFGNLRGILHQGVGEYLDYLIKHPDPLHPIRLIEDLDDNTRREAERWLEIILQTVIENYDIYKDYNTTATQSDYGENLYILFDFLRLKASYERQAWYFRPLVHVHEILARRCPSAATAWQEQFTRAAEPLAERHLKQLAQLERTHGVRLNTVRDRLEERFVKPLTMDRICALIEPTMNAAGGPDGAKALATFEEHLRPCAETPTGVGLDVPHWLQRIETTIHQVKSSRTAIAGLAENLLQIPRKKLTLADLEQQLIVAPDEPSWGNLWNAIITALGQIGGS